MPDFKATQQAFMAHIRNPEANAFNYAIEDRRMVIYRELFFNNIKSFLDSGFPVLSEILGEQRWQQLARQFFAEHDCRSPYFVDISKEFVEFLSNQCPVNEQDPPFVLELAHYEWLELDISVRKHQAPQLLPAGHVQLSDLAQLVSYAYPVHQISVDFQPQQPGEQVFILVYRDADEEVKFTLLNPASAYLVDVIQQQENISTAQLLETMCRAMPQLPVEQVEQGARQTLTQLLNQQILLSSDLNC